MLCPVEFMRGKQHGGTASSCLRHETINKVTDAAGKVVDKAADLGTGVVGKVVDKGAETVEKAVDTAVDKAIDGVFGVFGGGGSPEPKPPIDPRQSPTPKAGK